MATYIGIDLGTSNSAIATFDGQETRVWKNNSMDVTPSCIYIDKHGRKLYGQRAYQMQAISDDRVAKQFKRFMGTSTKIKFSGGRMDSRGMQCGDSSRAFPLSAGRNF